MRRGDGTRAELLLIIQECPGIHASKLCRDTGRSWGTVQYHLKWLLRQGEVRVRMEGRLVRLFTKEVSPEEEELLSLLHSELPRGILEQLAAHPGAPIQHISQSLQASRRTIRRHIVQLEEAGLLVRVTGDGLTVPEGWPAAGGRLDFPRR